VYRGPVGNASEGIFSCKITPAGCGGALVVPPADSNASVALSRHLFALKRKCCAQILHVFVRRVQLWEFVCHFVSALVRLGSIVLLRSAFRVTADLIETGRSYFAQTEDFHFALILQQRLEKYP
jgi:hypothetical protein